MLPNSTTNAGRRAVPRGRPAAPRAVDLGAEDPGEGLGGLVREQPVLDDAGGVHDAVQPAVLGVDLLHGLEYRRGVADVDRVVADPAAQRAQLGQGGGDLPRRRGSAAASRSISAGDPRRPGRRAPRAAPARSCGRGGVRGLRRRRAAGVRPTSSIRQRAAHARATANRAVMPRAPPTSTTTESGSRPSAAASAAPSPAGPAPEAAERSERAPASGRAGGDRPSAVRRTTGVPVGGGQFVEQCAGRRHRRTRARPAGRFDQRGGACPGTRWRDAYGTARAARRTRGPSRSSAAPHGQQPVAGRAAAPPGARERLGQHRARRSRPAGRGCEHAVDRAVAPRRSRWPASAASAASAPWSATPAVGDRRAASPARVPAPSSGEALVPASIGPRRAARPAGAAHRSHPRRSARRRAGPRVQPAASAGRRPGRAAGGRSARAVRGGRAESRE